MSSETPQSDRLKNGASIEKSGDNRRVLLVRLNVGENLDVLVKEAEKNGLKVASMEQEPVQALIFESRQDAVRAVEVLDDKVNWRGRSVKLEVKATKAELKSASINITANASSTTITSEPKEKFAFGLVDESGLALQPPNQSRTLTERLEPGTWVCFSNTQLEVINREIKRMGTVIGVTKGKVTILPASFEKQLGWSDKVKLSFQPPACLDVSSFSVGATVLFQLVPGDFCKPQLTNVEMSAPPPRPTLQRRGIEKDSTVTIGSDTSWEKASGPPAPDAKGFTSKTWRFKSWRVERLPSDTEAEPSEADKQPETPSPAYLETKS